MFYRSKLYQYNDKISFETKPSEPISRRPIPLEGFKLHVQSQEPPFDLTLIPMDEFDDRNPIELRCDTLAEATMWIDALQYAIQTADSHHISSAGTSSSNDIHATEKYTPPTLNPLQT